MSESIDVPRGATMALASSGQRQLWIHDRLYAHDGAYNILMGLRFDGPLDVDVLRQAFSDVVARHESLRTSFVFEQDDVYQLISECLDVAMPLVAVDAATVAEAMALVQESLEREGAAPFDLDVCPLFRATLFRLGPGCHALALVLHHTIFDGWSVGVMVNEIGAFYDARQRGQTADLPPLAIQYADFAEWQREQLDRANNQPALEYWRRQLAAAATHIALPADRPRRRTTSRRGRMLAQAAPPALRDAIMGVCRTENATLFMVLMTAFSVVLHRYARQRDVLIGTPVAGRTRQELEPLIGDFINTVLIRSTIEPNTTFRDLLGQIRTATLEAQTHQDVPFDRQQELATPRSSEGDRFDLQVLIALQSATPEPRGFGGLDVSLFWGHNGTAKYELFLNLVDDSRGLRFELEYDVNLFEPATAIRLLDSYAIVLAAASAAPGASVATLPLLTAADRALMSATNATDRLGPQPATVLAMFEAQVARTPSRRAVVFEGRSLSYADLDHRAARIAAELQSLGAGPDVLVGLYVRRSDDMVAAVLGILKAGAAYVPIDPSYPAERVALVLEDAAAPLLITQSSLERSLPQTSARVILLDRLDHQQRPLTPSTTTGDHLAYVLYTSGSTGRPKGVEIPHRALVNFLVAMQREPGFSADDQLLAVTTLSFDIAGLELLLPLVTGGSVVVASSGAAMDPSQLRLLMKTWPITVLQATPTTWRLLLESGWAGKPGLKILCGGEAMPPDLAEALLPRCGELWNMYGPTETTVWSLVRRITDDQIDIGHPIDNTDVLVVDEAGQEVPVGVPGELMIGGLGLARGYRGRPDLTAERFIPHPTQVGRRAYRTGDLARWQPDGTLDCLGRLDHQVKIRGFRIELGEIEAILSQHPEVGACVVVAREDRPGDRRLVAYLSTAGEEIPSTEALRAHLSRHVPEYMLPAAFVVMPVLPLTPNGKIDRKALPAPNAAPTPARELDLPRTDTERALTEIWKEVLGLPVINRLDRFFDLGGHSLAALRIFGRIESRLGVSIPLSALLDSPSIAEVAARIDAVTGSDHENPYPSLVKIKDGDGPPLFCVHSLSGDVMEYRDISNHLPRGQAVIGIHAVLDEKLEERYSTIEATAQSYVADIRKAQPAGPYYLCGWSSAGTVVFEMAQQLQAAGETVAVLAIIDSAPVNVQIAPPSTLTRWARQILNVPMWLRDDLFQLNWRQFQARVSHRLSVLKRRRSRPADAELTVRDVVAFPERTGPWERFAELHFRSFLRYRPTPYAGVISVFTAPTHPLFRLNDPVPAWRTLCQTVDAYTASGTHFNVVREPYVRVLSVRMAEAIRKARSAMPNDRVAGDQAREASANLS